MERSTPDFDNGVCMYDQGGLEPSASLALGREV